MERHTAQLKCAMIKLMPFKQQSTRKIQKGIRSGYPWCFSHRFSMIVLPFSGRVKGVAQHGKLLFVNERRK